VDTGATNRKLGSDMGDSVTGGGLHGKDLSKADVSVNIWAWLKAQETGTAVELSCSIGDDVISGVPYAEIVETARKYIEGLGGFEKFAEWGLIR
jgi:S-adenosylmethionine synthetase